MALKQTLVSIRKMASKDPLKMVFVLLLVSVLPLLVIGTLTEVLLKSRAAYPISGATGSDEMRLKYRGSFIEGPSCPSPNGPCTNGKEIIVFYNASNKTLSNVRVDKIISGTRNSEVIDPPLLKPFLTSSDGSQRETRIDKVLPTQEVYVGVEAAKPLSQMVDPFFGDVFFNGLKGKIFFTGSDCVAGTDSCTTQWAQPSVELAFDETLKSMAPERYNHFVFTNPAVRISLDGFVIKKDNKFYYGSSNMNTTVTKPSNNQMIVTTSWSENGNNVSLKFDIQKNANEWWVENLSFDANGVMNFPRPFFPSDGKNAIEEKNLALINHSAKSYILLVYPNISATWVTVEQNNSSEAFDLNNDFVLDLKDYTLFANSYGQSTADRDVKADINNDGTVDQLDENKLIRQINLLKLERFN